MPRRAYRRGSAAVCQKRYSSPRTTAEDHQPIQANRALENCAHQPRASISTADWFGASRLTLLLRRKARPMLTKRCAAHSVRVQKLREENRQSGELVIVGLITVNDSACLLQFSASVLKRAGRPCWDGQTEPNKKGDGAFHARQSRSSEPVSCRKRCSRLMGVIFKCTACLDRLM